MSYFNNSHDDLTSHLIKKQDQDGDGASQMRNRLCGSVQTDGRKVHGTEKNNNDDDMSRPTARNTTFRNFPKKILIDKIIDSGYFYTGRGDQTKCFKCNVCVDDWNDKDNPAFFHEPCCPFYLSQPQPKVVEGSCKDENISLEEKVPSILDAPIEKTNDINIFAPILTPTIARSQSHESQGYGRQKIAETFDIGEEASNSLPALVRTKESAGQSEKTKQFIRKPQHKPYFSATGKIDREHETLLKSLNICSEEDRRFYSHFLLCFAAFLLLPIFIFLRFYVRYRKTFHYKKCWKQNTNNVIHPSVLAADGFLYLGSLDRTQCFSCDRIFKTWLRNDNVNLIHRQNVPYCRMAKGKETRNIQIPWFQASNDSSSTGSSNTDTIILSASKVSEEENYLESSLEISKSGFSEEPGYIPTLSIVLIPASPAETLPFKSHSGNELQHRSIQPLDLSLNNDLQLSIQHSDFPLLSPSNTSVNVEDNQEQDPSILPQNAESPKEHFSVQQSSEEDPLPQDRSSSLTHEEHDIEMLPYTYTSWPMAQAAVSTTPRNTPFGSMEYSPSSVSVQVATPTEISTNMVSESEQENTFSEIFQCCDPVSPDRRSISQRRATFEACSTPVSVNVDEFVRAGFYYNARNGQLECWYCGGEIPQWNSITEPWECHAQRYPNCEYLLQQKGPGFVAEVSSRHRPPTPPVRPPTPISPQMSSSSDVSPFSSMESSQTSFPPRVLFNYVGSRGVRFSSSPPPTVVDPREEETKHKKMLEEALNSEVTIAVMGMGFDIEAIKKGYKRKIETTDANFSSTEALLDALLVQSPTELDSSDSEEDEPRSPQGEEPSTSAASSSGGAQGSDLPQASSSTNVAQSLDPKELDSKLREYEQEKRCKVCLDRNAEVVFVPCGHLCTCIQCANALRSCPLCRKKIKKSMKIYTA